MKEVAGASPDDPATSDMVSGRKLQPGKPRGPLCFELAPLIGGEYLPVPYDRRASDRVLRLAVRLPNELNRPHC
jgi:hypothetical protein